MKCIICFSETNNKYCNVCNYGYMHKECFIEYMSKCNNKCICNNYYKCDTSTFIIYKILNFFYLLRKNFKRLQDISFYILSYNLYSGVRWDEEF